MTGDPWNKLSGCTCYVRHLDDETRLRLRPGAHDPACPVYMPSLDRDHAREDAEFRQAATGQCCEGLKGWALAWHRYSVHGGPYPKRKRPWLRT